MSNTGTNQSTLEIVNEYFRRIDAGREDVVELLTDDVEIYFPKFGTAKGKAALFECAGQITATVTVHSHNVDPKNCYVVGNTVVAEGTSRGVTKKGVTWAGGETAGGRFCNVFHFRDGKIACLHIYLDPDYGSEDRDRFLWGTERSW